MATSDHAERPADGDEQRDSNTGCPECGDRIRSRAGEAVCAGCGLVLEEQRIDNGPEWRTSGDSESSTERTGAPLTPSRHDRGLSTVIGRGGDARGNPLSGRKRRQVGRMRREQSRGRWRSKAERNLAHGLSETHRVASASTSRERFGIRRANCSGVPPVRTSSPVVPSSRSPRRASTGPAAATGSRGHWR